MRALALRGFKKDVWELWDDEVKRRVNEIKSGAENGIPAAKLMKDVFLRGFAGHRRAAATMVNPE